MDAHLTPPRSGGRPRGTTRAELRGPLERLEVDVDQPEPVAEAVHPLEVVLGAPEEVPVHGHALRRGPLQLPQARPQEHAVGVVDPAVLGDGVRAPQPFSVMKIDFALQIDCTCLGAQYITSGSRTCHEDCILGWEALIAISR